MLPARQGWNGECQAQEVCSPRLHQDVIIRRRRWQQEARVLFPALQTWNGGRREEEVRPTRLYLVPCTQLSGKHQFSLLRAARHGGKRSFSSRDGILESE